VHKSLTTKQNSFSLHQILSFFLSFFLCVHQSIHPHTHLPFTVCSISSLTNLQMTNTGGTNQRFNTANIKGTTEHGTEPVSSTSVPHNHLLPSLLNGKPRGLANKALNAFLISPTKPQAQISNCTWDKCFGKL